MEELPYEIILVIVDLCNLLTKIRFMSINKYLYENINIFI